jgi:SAM-dependent methyltransferase
MDAQRLHEHYRLQAAWLAPSRRYLFRKAGVAGRRRILDLGCGSGVIAEELRRACGRPVLAVDRDPALTELARRLYPGNEYLAGDERRLLRAGRRFDLVVISFVLLWQRRPLPFLKRLRGLLDEGGALLVLAEPDYGCRVDQPQDLAFLGPIFAGHIRSQGGDPCVGRSLASLLQRAGFRAQVELASILDFPRPETGAEWEREWRFWRDLAGFSAGTLRRILLRERRAIARNERMVLFPVFCALARP